MNSLKKTLTAAGAALIISFITIVFPFIALSEENHPLSFPHVYKDLTPAQEKDRARKAKQTAISAAAGVLKKTHAWKRVAGIQKRISEQYSFEFRKNFSEAGSIEEIRETGTDNKIEKSGELVFSGGLGLDMRPSLSMVSGFRRADVGVRFDLLDRELDCEKSQAIKKISFEF